MATTRATSSPPNRPTPLFAPSLGPPPKPSPSTSPPNSTTPPRRTLLSPRKRTPTSSRLVDRRRSFSSNTVPTPSSSGSSGSSTPQSIVQADGYFAGGGFTFVPSETSSVPSRESRARDAFDLHDMAMEIDEVAGMLISPPPPRYSEAPTRVTLRKPRSRMKRAGRTNINDLPDELLLRIFGFLNDQQGFRPLPGRTVDTPEWYTPPLRVALVCQRWLPLARHLYYRFVKISHLSRISALHAAFTANGDLLLSVRHLTIDLPITAADKLRLQAPTSLTTREADSDADSTSPSKKRKPLTMGDELRAVFQSCSRLLSLEISGFAPALLLSSSSRALSALHHLHQLRLSTVTQLTLHGGTGDIEGGGDGVPVLGAVSVRDALLALTGLRRLTLKGYTSSRTAEGALDFAPTRTHLGLSARPLPLRARVNALLPLERLVLVECCVSPTDLHALLSHCQRGKLRYLAVDDHWSAATAHRNRKEGRWDKPTVESLHEVTDLVRGSVEHFRATLFNYPPVTGIATAVASTALRSPERMSPPHRVPRALPGAATPTKGEKHLLDWFIAQLEALVTLDLGGSVASPALFLLRPPTSPSLPSTPALPPPETPHLPVTLRTLTLRSCDLLPPFALLPLLRSPPPQRPHLQTLRTLGGSEHGWARPDLSLAVQRACWAARVRWVSGAEGGVIAAMLPVEAGHAAGAADVVAAGERTRRVGDRVGGGW